jgi:hypothetical protein
MKTLFKYLNEIVWEAISLLGKCVPFTGIKKEKKNQKKPTL